MRSLNTSLPRSFPRRHPPADLHQAFKQAALSVAQLYKTAAADEDHARSIGYQDAIEELLAFLDQENLGLGDGEGWRVRQWATERLSPEAYGSDREDDSEESRPMRSSSPILQRRPDPVVATRLAPSTVEVRQPEPVQTQAPPPPAPINITSRAEQEIDANPVRPETFHFRSPAPIPTDTTMMNSERQDLPTAASSSTADRSSTPSTAHRPMRRQNSRQSLRERASASALAALGLGSGAKRKSPFNDYVDMNSLDNNRDNVGGSKRGRFV